MMSPDQFASLISVFKEMMEPDDSSAAPGAALPPGLGHQGRRLVGKHFRSDVFAGDVTKFDDWNFAFKRGIRSLNRQAYDMMIESEKMNDDLVEESDVPP